MAVFIYLDTILVSFSLFLMGSYHAYLWYFLKNNPSQTTIGVESQKRKLWVQCFKEGDDKKNMLAVQSLRNTQMATIFTATIAVLVNMALAALTNNTYSTSHLFHGPFFGSPSTDQLYLVKFGAASLFLLTSLLCTSIGLGFLVDANFLLNITTSTVNEFASTPGYTQRVSEQGFLLAFIGNRALCCSFPVLAWMFGPVPVVLSAVGLVWGLHELDFCGNVVSGTAKGFPDHVLNIIS